MSRPTKEQFANGSIYSGTVIEPSPDLMTDGGYGDYRRLRVDVGQTGFFAGREFRAIYEFSIATGATQVIKVVAPCDTIVQTFSAELQTAKLRIELIDGGT